MSRRKAFTGIITLIMVAVGYWVIWKEPQSKEIAYRFGQVSLGDIKQTVSATGAVTPVVSVEVGTQISGTIDSVMVDFNQNVKAGQVLAVLDTTLLRATVLDADASVERAKAKLEEAQSEYKRNLSLFDRKLISEADFTTFKVAVKTSEADLKSAEAALVRARTNLQYAVIRSPVDGIVIERNVEEGQTVAASFSTPTLFIIAQDLAQMEILADVDESDIGSIKVGQSAEFEVAAYPDKTFSGKVIEIRLQPTTISNVVTYTVVVAASNPDRLLLPGMTATLEIVTEERLGVLTVPTQALNFEPSEAVLAQLHKQSEQRHVGNMQDTTGPAPPPRGFDKNKRPSVVWYIDSTGTVAPAPMVAGLSDGATTEIEHSRKLTAGMQVIVGTIDNSSTKTSSERSSPRRFRPPRF